jgi:hypothetical protein
MKLNSLHGNEKHYNCIGIQVSREIQLSRCKDDLAHFTRRLLQYRVSDVRQILERSSKLGQNAWNANDSRIEILLHG